MPIEAWIVAGICIALEVFCIIMMFVLSFPRDYVHGAPFRIPPPPIKPYEIEQMQGKPMPYRHIGHVVMPVTNIKPGMNPPKTSEKQLLRYECEKCGTMQHTYTRQEGIKCIVCGDGMKEVLWFNPDGTTAKPPIRDGV